MVLIPTSGAVFQVPSTVQLRPLPLSTTIGASTGLKQLQSGAIRVGKKKKEKRDRLYLKVLDMKTIEVTEFILQTDGLPVWFMVGKEIMPNANGYIVPTFDRFFDYI